MIRVTTILGNPRKNGNTAKVLEMFEELMTQLYTYSFPAQMKALVDRQNCLVTGYGTAEYTPLLGGKRAALLVTCGGPVEENADLIQEAFDRESRYQQMNVFGMYVVPHCTTPDSLGDKAMETAKKMAEDIVGG